MTKKTDVIKKIRLLIRLMLLAKVTKLLSRIVAPSHLEELAEKKNARAAATLHDHTYGITSDPLTQFACAFSALVHDVDHAGVPNPTLIKENEKMGQLYNGRSVAEQNSLDLAWSMLMDERFRNLRGALFSSKSDFCRFRDLVINSVLATDIADKELKQLRNNRWQKAFDPSSGIEEDVSRDAVNRKATIVIEHLIQASDVSHTMQHWHVYRKWNQRLFEECYRAYQAGRAEENPAIGWAKGELGFFDFYIIPLAKKLKECGVFGKSSDEYLNYALQNRGEWATKGDEVVEEMMEQFRSEL